MFVLASAIKQGIPYANGAPNLSADIPALIALAAALLASSASADTLVSNINGIQVGADGKVSASFELVFSPEEIGAAMAEQAAAITRARRSSRTLPETTMKNSRPDAPSRMSTRPAFTSTSSMRQNGLGLVR